jgi:hypothetical protein
MLCVQRRGGERRSRKLEKRPCRFHRLRYIFHQTENSQIDICTGTDFIGDAVYQALQRNFQACFEWLISMQPFPWFLFQTTAVQGNSGRTV